MKQVLFALLMLFSTAVFATNNPPNPCGNHGNNCNNDIPPQQDQRQNQEQYQHQGQAQSQEANASAIAWSSAAVSSENTNSNTNIAVGGEGGRGGNGYGGSAYAEGGVGIGVGGNQGQSQYSDNSNSSNNSSSQSTSLTFQSTGEAKYANKYGNNVGAYAPAIYSSSACTAGGLSGGASAFGAGISFGGAKQDPQCQIRENARILAGLDAALAIMYLCKNPGVDVGAVLGEACTPPVVIVVPEPEPKTPEVVPPVEVVDKDVKG